MDNSVLQGELLLSNKLPLTYQLMLIIKRNIVSGNAKPGSQLPTEEEFCKTYNISRSTVRNALAELEEAGLINRVRGKGTFISETKLRRKMEQVYSFTHEMEALGLTPSSQIIDFEKTEAGDMSAIFNIDPHDHVFHITRIRMANGEPLLLEATYIPVKYYALLTREKLENNSLYNLLRNNAGIYPAIAEETYECVVLEPKIAEILQCAPKTPSFYIERTTKQANGEVYELTQSFMRSDRSKIVLTLQQDIYTFNRDINL